MKETSVENLVWCKFSGKLRTVPQVGKESRPLARAPGG